MEMSCELVAIQIFHPPVATVSLPPAVHAKRDSFSRLKRNKRKQTGNWVQFNWLISLDAPTRWKMICSRVSIVILSQTATVVEC